MHTGEHAFANWLPSAVVIESALHYCCPSDKCCAAAVAQSGDYCAGGAVGVEPGRLVSSAAAASSSSDSSSGEEEEDTISLTLAGRVIPVSRNAWPALAPSLGFGDTTFDQALASEQEQAETAGLGNSRLLEGLNTLNDNMEKLSRCLVPETTTGADARNRLRPPATPSPAKEYRPGHVGTRAPVD